MGGEVEEHSPSEAIANECDKQISDIATDLKILNQVALQCEKEFIKIMVYPLGLDTRGARQYREEVAKEVSKGLTACTAWLLKLLQTQLYAHLITPGEAVMLDQVVVYEMIEFICNGVLSMRERNVMLQLTKSQEKKEMQ